MSEVYDVFQGSWHGEQHDDTILKVSTVELLLDYFGAEESLVQPQFCSGILLCVTTLPGGKVANAFTAIW